MVPAVAVTLAEEEGLSQEGTALALLAAGGVGLVVAMRATFAAEVAGCQVEIGAAGAMVMGALFSKDQQAGSVGVLLGLGLAALGGAMAPIEIFPESMKMIAKFTPHYWALDGFAELVRRDGTILDIGQQLGVLFAFAAVLMLFGAWRLRRVLTR